MLKIDDKRFAQEFILEFTDGETIFAEGDEGREMYIVQEGQVRITKKSATGELPLANLHKGDFVGEMALLESLPRSATAKAVGKTRLMVLQPGGFLLKIRRDPTLAFEMLQRLSRRIRTTNEKLLDAVNRGNSIESIRQIVQGSEFAQPKAENAIQR